MVVIVNLQNLCTTIEHASLIGPFVELLPHVRERNWLFYLGNCFSCENRLVYHTCSSEEQYIARNILIGQIFFFFFALSQHFTRNFGCERDGLCQKLAISDALVLRFLVLVSRLNGYDIAWHEFIGGFDSPSALLEDVDLVRGEGHRAIANEGFNPLNWHCVGCPYDHCEDHYWKHSIIVHQPKEHWKDLEEYKRIDDLIPENALKGSNRYFQNIIIEEFLFLWVVQGLIDDVSDFVAFQFGLQPIELKFLLIEVELPLLEVEDVQVLAVLEFLLVQVADPVDCALSFLLLPHVNVAGVLKILLQWSGERFVLYERLELLGPVAEDVGETWVLAVLLCRKHVAMMLSLR